MRFRCIKIAHFSVVWMCKYAGPEEESHGVETSPGAGSQTGCALASPVGALLPAPCSPQQGSWNPSCCGVRLPPLSQPREKNGYSLARARLLRGAGLSMFWPLVSKRENYRPSRARSAPGPCRVQRQTGHLVWSTPGGSCEPRHREGPCPFSVRPVGLKWAWPSGRSPQPALASTISPGSAWPSHRGPAPHLEEELASVPNPGPGARARHQVRSQHPARR